ncbi:1-phosphatidylinositol 3-phosphate 5-kinase isoform X2 [Bacillus rossius redtenbacheri]|uniref:1-phosphatidylinositol 3-phosphate 5-kinase isoform X2 n=1 Tax=Bacillus rossius redtenbacheri TaxID=93214 RepID=UPI002FDEE6CB
MSRLTEFAPLSPEDSQPGVGSLLSKFFKFGKSGMVQDSSPPNCNDAQTDSQTLQSDPDSRDEDLDTVVSFQAEGRSLQNVLKRIRSLLVLKSTGLQAYKDTDFKQYWMPDSVSKECYYCGERFTTFRRRHHCRVCGQIFCSRCCNQVIPGKIMGCTGDLRVCAYCCKVVLSYLQSSDAEEDLTADLRAVQEDLLTKYGSDAPQASAGPGAGPGVADAQDSTPARRKTSLCYQEDRFAPGRAQSAGYLSMEEACRALQMSASLRALFDDMCHPSSGIPLQTHRFRLRNHHNCFLGSELVQWLIAQSHASTRDQGTAIGQALLVAGYLDPLVSSEHNFVDGYALYRPVQNLSPHHRSEPEESQSLSQDAQEPLWVKQILQDDPSTAQDSENESTYSKQDDSGSLPSSGSLFYLDLNLESNTAHLGSRQRDDCAKTSSPRKSDSHRTGVSSPLQDCSHVGITNEFLSGSLLSQSEERRPCEGWHNVSQLRTDNGELQSYTKLSSAYKQHGDLLLKQLLTAEGLAHSWGDVLLPLAQQIVATVRPNVRNEVDDMDVRLYVRFKKVPGGSRSECSVVNGVVCTKNVAHRAMNTMLMNPRILLLGCTIAYQRDEERLLSLEPVMMQEFEYLRNVVARIANLRPDLVLVQRNVSRLAQEFLMDLNITLVLNVKASVLERVARCTQADIVGSVDAHIGRPQLGTCQLFHLETFTTDKGMRKTLLFFEGCPLSHLGCTVLLRGASVTELTKLKRVATFLTYVEYSWRLEKSFLMDEFAQPPSPPVDSFFQDCVTNDGGLASSPVSLCDNQRLAAASSEQLGEDGASLSSAHSREVSDAGEVPAGVQQLQRLLLEEDVAAEPKPGRAEVSADLSCVASTVLSASDRSRNTKRDKVGLSIGKELSCSFSEACSSIDDINETRSSLEDASEIHSIGDVASEELKKQCAFCSKESENSLNKVETRDTDESKCNCRAWRGRALAKERSLTDDRRVNVESVSDFSDPLHLYLGQDDEVFASSPPPVQELSVAEIPTANYFRKALDETILSASPFLKFTVPYLETEIGRNCELRKFFPKQIFWSSQISELSESRCHRQETSGHHEAETMQKEVKLLAKHQFVDAKLTAAAESREVQTMLAHYRACGGRLLPPGHCGGAEPPGRQEPLGPAPGPPPPDALDVTRHQHLAVLFCSYSQESNNTPAFCVNPWIVFMDFYGHNDIPLGSFLERYCFRKSYVCPSESCDTPMLQHVRRFVHNQGCVHITLREVDSNLFDSADSSHIFMWSLCSKCKSGTPVVRMSDDTWSFSFAKYLELRFHGHMYRRRGRDADCQHSLHHDHYQYFSSKNVVVSFKYSSVVMWEVSLPPSAIELATDPWQQSNIIEDVKQLALKGYEVYCLIMDRLAALESDVENLAAMKQQLLKEQAHFKSCIEEVQLKLTSPTLESKRLEGKVSEKDVQQLMWHIEDSLVHLRKLISDAVSSWNGRVQDISVLSKKKRDGGSKTVQVSGALVEGDGHSQGRAVEDDTSSCSEGRESPVSPRDGSGAAAMGDPAQSLDAEDTSCSGQPLDTLDNPDGTALLQNVGSPPNQVLPPEMSSTPEERHLQPPQSDKKSVKNILSQLLPSTSGVTALQSPLSSQEHHLSCVGCSVPVVIYENEPSSIIAHALSSQDYHRSLWEATTKKQPPVDQQNSSGGVNPGHTDGSQHGTVTTVSDLEKPAESEEKKAQPTAHIEVQFSDATSKFHCLVYYAEQFSALRQSVVPAGEESYVRSLARCVQWAARGGKSGSSFCKTKDDRYIIKEMSKLEKDLFLEFAPNYFGYMQRCYTSNQPTLLGKIVGVYRVAYRNMNSNATLRSILLVMENLFYGRTVTHKFDLKGSVRNRLANTTLQQEGEIVLLDENLLKMTCDSPLYILPHSKTVLTEAINNDTMFLSSQSVIDYSLLVGLDQERLELVVGIIDYIRTFTWDKKLETMVKSSGILGGQGKQPTVVSPELYRARFIAAMHKYFLPVPDRWMGLGRAVDC